MTRDENAPGEATLRFSEVVLDVAARRLEVAGREQRLEPKAFDLLVLLVHERHRVVGKDELLSRIWPGRIVVEGALKRAIGLVRQALGDEASAPRFIRTVHGVGYQFVAEPEPLQPVPSVAREPHRVKAEGRPLLWRGLTAVIALLLLVLAYANLWRDAVSVDPPALQVLVLPFENASGDARLDWVERGLPGLVAHALVEEPGLSLMPVEAGARLALDAGLDFGASDAELQALRSLVGADLAVLGRVVPLPDGWRLDLRIALSDGRVDERGLQANELVALATDTGFSELRRSLLGRAGRIVSGLSPDPFVNETYARARAALAAGDWREARDLLAVVVRAAPLDLHARLDLVEAEHTLGEREGLQALLAPLQAAVDDTPGSALALRLARFHGQLADAAGDRESAAVHYREALELARLRGDRLAEADALRLLGTLASAAGEWDAADRLLGQALATFDLAGHEPGRGLVLNNLGVLHWRRDQLAESAHWHAQALESFSRSGRRDHQASALGNLATLDFRQGRLDAALERYQQALDLHRELGNRSSELIVRGNLARSALFLGRLGEVEQHAGAVLAAAEASDDPRNGAFARLLLGLAAARAGQVDAGLAKLQRAAEGFEAIAASDYALSARMHQVRVLAEAGRAESAASLLLEQAPLLESVSTPNTLSQVAWARAALAAAEGRGREAVEHMWEGRELALQAGSPLDVLSFTSQLAMYLLRAGMIDEAEAWIGRLDDHDGRLPEVRLVKARHAYERGEFQRALELIQAARAQDEASWTEARQAQLQRYEQAAALGERLDLGDELGA